MLALCAGTVGSVLVMNASASDAGARRPAKKGALSPRERRALNVVAVRASGAEGAGLLVTATFQGNIEKAIGRGHLKSALVAVLLRPADASRPVVGVATRRAGSIGDTVTNAGAAQVGVVRNGRKLTFYIGEGRVSLGDYPDIQVKAFARYPLRSSHRRASASVTADFWDEIDRQIAADETGIPRPEREVQCRLLQEAQQELDVVLKRAKEREAQLDKARRVFERTIPELEDDLRLGRYAHAGSVVLSLVSGAVAPFAVLMSATPGAAFGAAALGVYAHALNATATLRGHNEALRDAIRGLKLDVRLADAYIAKNRALIEKLTEVRGKAAALAKIACVPPTLTPIHAVFDQVTRSTVYTENATGQDLKYRWTISIPFDPPCANGFQPGVPQPNQATWNHADNTEKGGSCNHAVYDAQGGGHPGTVTVQVYNRSWRCVATFTGSQGDTGEPVGDGPAAGPCELE